jgi:hypothetical protein
MLASSLPAESVLYFLFTIALNYLFALQAAMVFGVQICPSLRL